MKSFLWSVLSLYLLVIAGCAEKKDLLVYGLQCENLTDPVAIDKSVPRFGWKVNSEENGTVQQEFQIMVASRLALLNEKDADLWNPGKTASSSSVYVPYKGKTLTSGMFAYWKVRVWDQNGRVSSWSEPARFGVGMLHADDWKAEYIAYDTENGYRECPQLYGTFEADGDGHSYVLYVNSLGYHEVYVNGIKADDGVLTPAVSQFDKRSLVNAYDITPFVKSGRNDLLIWLGSGWYTEGLPGVVNNGPVVRAQVLQVSGEKSSVIAVTDETWKGRRSGYTRHGDWRSNRFGGEILDGSLMKSALNSVEQPGNEWNPVTIKMIPPHEATPQMVELNIISDTITPSAVIQIGRDTFLADMGKNLTGWVDFGFSGLKKGQEVTIEYCDHMKDSKFNARNQWDRYVASGDGNDRFINKFNYHGFRYLRISGLGEIPDIDSIRGYLVHTGFDMASGFECSDQDLNQIHDMLKYTLRCLSIGGDLVDCPQIERLGYGGDGNASTVTAQTMFGLGPLYNNWLQAWADVVREDGGMPHTAPNPYRAGGGPYWCGFIITASWQTFLHYGDTAILRKHYPVMQKWLGYVDLYSPDKLLKRWPDTDYRGWYLGDWATPEGIDQTAEASVDVVNNSFIAVCYDNMEKIARITGNEHDAKLYAAKKKEISEKIHSEFFIDSLNSYGTGTQIDLAFPMIAGVVPEALYKQVSQSLLKETEVNRKGHFACGLVGLPVLTEWAEKNRQPDFFYSMLKKREYPGYLYMTDNGATTTWEHWNGNRSHIHNCYNGIGSWFYRALGGIRPADDVPACRKVFIDPQIPNGVTWSKTFRETPFGKISADWKLENNVMEIQVQIPVGVSAEVVIPDGVKTYSLDHVKHQRETYETTVILPGSGKYQISYEMD